jgi:hypothetical protein
MGDPSLPESHAMYVKIPRVAPIAFVVPIIVITSGFALARSPRVTPIGTVVDDSRLQPLKDLDGRFPFEPSSSIEEWNQRADSLRTSMKVALGLWPLPTKTPDQAVVHGRIEFPDYTIDKVYLESFPGFYVTGNLYLPRRVAGKLPAVLCPHGHFVDGRFGDEGLDTVRRNIVIGAERFENGGRNVIQSICVQLARMGCAVFNYDMIGYCDSVQISFDLAHRFATQRPEMNTPSGWGLFSPQAEAHLQSIMGMQTYNSIRALDWVASLPYVDSSRIAVTGASGGGTQTFILCAMDERPSVAVPAVMVSTAMQGGCTCENACLLRVGAGNCDFAALIAPRPLCLISANDWTKDMPTDGFPQLEKHFAMVQATDRLSHAPLLHFGHNYNYVSRAVMYHFANQHLRLGLPEPIVEEDYQRLSGKELTVWDAQHPAPVATADFERGLLKWWTEDAERQIAATRPASRGSMNEYRQLVGAAVRTLIGRGLPAASCLEFQEVSKTPRDGYLEIAGSLRNDLHDGRHESIPTAFLMPNDWNQGGVVLWLTGRGKDDLYTADGAPRPAIRKMLERGFAVVGADLFMQGEFLPDGQPISKTRKVNNSRESAAYTFGYNHSLFAQRVHDILSLVSFAKNHHRNPSRIHIVGLDGAGPWVAAARAVTGAAIPKAAVDTQGFRFHHLNDFHHPDFLPGGAKYDDLPGMLALSAPEPLLVAGESADALTFVRQAFEACGAGANLRTVDGREDAFEAAAIDWLTGP